MYIYILIVLIIGVLAWVFRPKWNMSKYSKYAMLSVISLSLVFLIAAVISQLIHNASGVVEISPIADAFSIANLVLAGATLLVVIGLVVKYKGETAKALGYGIFIAVALSVLEFGLLEWLAGV